MDQGGRIAVDPEAREPVSSRPVLSLLGGIDPCRKLSSMARLVEVSGSIDGTLIRLHLEPNILSSFPERARDARDGFLRFFRDIDHEAFREGDVGTPVIRLKQAVRAGLFLTLDRKLHKRLYRPLSAREAASFLGLDKKTFRRLREDFGISPCERIPASRHGRAYSYAVFSVPDVIRMQSMLPPLCHLEKGRPTR